MKSDNKSSEFNLLSDAFNAASEMNRTFNESQKKSAEVLEKLKAIEDDSSK